MAGKAVKAVGKAAEQSLVTELDQEVDSVWPITPQRRELIVRALLEVVISGDSDTAKVRAAEVLGKLDGLSAIKRQDRTSIQNAVILQPAYSQLSREASETITRYLAGSVD